VLRTSFYIGKKNGYDEKKGEAWGIPPLTGEGGPRVFEAQRKQSQKKKPEDRE